MSGRPGVYQKRTDVPGAGSELWCGTAGGYGNHGCRCDGCLAEWAALIASVKRNRLSRPVPDDIHGRRATYCNYNCRCELCMDAARAYWSEYRARRRAAAT